jgi:2-polyprenyl-3-methyl-5-hydroxy-6-metoxy-1,4-benzoquinol methylase
MSLEKTPTRPCPICGTSDHLSAGWWAPRLIRCRVCGLVYVQQLPTLAELEAIYSAEYWQGSSAYTDYLADKAGTQAHFRHRIKILRKLTSGSDLFEAGCAYGFFLELAQQHWNVQGIDISAEAVTYARDVLHLPVQQGDFESHPPAPKSFDVVVMWDTIEHLYDPVLAVQKIAEALKPGGILALTTGDIDAFLPRLQKKSWRMIILAHLYYFSRQSITWLLHDHGLDIIHFSHVSYYRSLRQMAKIITWKHPTVVWRQKLLKRIEKLPLIDSQIPLNLYDIMLIIARKPG